MALCADSAILPSSIPLDIAEALKLMNDNLPATSGNLIDELGGSFGHIEPEAPNFRGWFGTIGGNSAWAFEAGMYSSPCDLSDIRYYAFWTYMRRNEKMFVVTIPSGQISRVSPGEALTLGEESVRIGSHSQEQLDNIVREGFGKLCELVS